MNKKEIEEMIGHGKKVKSITEFKDDGESFSANEKAEYKANELGYEIGSMCGDLPIALSKRCDYIAKWRNIPISDYHLLDGLLLSEDFRDGDVQLVEFEEVTT